LELTLGGDGDDLDDPLASFAYTTEDVHAHPEVLQQGRYHVVVGNPPYITVRDTSLKQLYKSLYKSSTRQFQLTVPFAERFFELAKAGSDGYGIVGQITSNAFMKREFGKKLVEGYFAHKVELLEVIDTAGAYIPGHGTPTVILVGKRRQRGRSATIRTVLGVHGEPEAPNTPSQGRVWRAIVEQIDRPGSENEWVTSGDTPRSKLARHPWSLSGGGASDLRDQLENEQGSIPLKDVIDDWGNMLNTREDDAYVTRGAARRSDVPRGLTRCLIEGSEIRDWGPQGRTEIIFPYDERGVIRRLEEGELRILWNSRTLLNVRKSLSGTQEERGLPWYGYSSFSPSRYTSEKSIVFTLVATHPHFLVRGSNELYSQAATVLNLSADSGVGVRELLGVLNSSVACFWLKQVSHGKGNGGVNEGLRGEKWEEFYEFTGTKLQEFPLPADYPTSLATALDTLAKQLAATSPDALVVEGTPAPGRLREAKMNWESIRARMVALQEEDWQVYSLYGVHEDDLRAPESDVPEIKPGQRAFEVVLARRVSSGMVSTDWFRRHGFTAVTELPEDWPAAYRILVERRIDAIEKSRALSMLERPEFKRRWEGESWDALQEKALRSPWPVSPTPSPVTRTSSPSPSSTRPARNSRRSSLS
jgi:hypothetical protein